MKKAIPITVLLLGLSAYVYFARIRPSREVDPTVRGTGSIEATEVLVAAKVPARIAKINVDEGDAVTAGQVLATLDCSDLEVRHAQAEAQLAQAQAGTAQAAAAERQAKGQLAPLQVQYDYANKERARVDSLFAAAAATQRTVDKAQNALRTIEEQLRAAELGVAVAQSSVGVARAQVALAQKSVDLAATQLTECTLTAPSAGVVMTKSREDGELVLPGATILELGQLDQVHTWIYVPNEEVGRVHLGQTVKLRADTYPDRVFTGTITRINDRAEFTPKSIQTKEDRTRLVFGVKVTVDNPDHALLPGMPVEAEVADSAAPPATASAAGATPSHGEAAP